MDSHYRFSDNIKNNPPVVDVPYHTRAKNRSKKGILRKNPGPKKRNQKPGFNSSSLA